eukprot:m.42470 g.42470  ORF g.42470 m.42470 type:complete len:228 (+) comp5728_c0_seq1:50-733(+)
MGEEHRNSLYEVIAKARRFETTKAMLGRLVMVSRVLTEDKEAVAVRSEEFLRAACKGPYSGLLLVYPKHAIFFLETHVDVTVPFVKFIGGLEKEGLLGGTRVLQTTDASRTVYKTFSHRVINLAATKTTEHKPAEALDVVVAEALGNMTKLGLFISSLPKESLQGVLDNLHEAVPELMCSQGLLEHLLKAEDLDGVPEYLARYAGPVDIVLDNEVVWPHPVRLFPYE